MRMSLCLLTWNEVQGCDAVLPHLSLEHFYEVFALDGGSTDGTAESLREHGVKVVSQRNRSYNAAYIEAIDLYIGDAIIFFHPKGSIDPLSIVQIAHGLSTGHDLVIASRMLPDSQNEEDFRLIRHRKWFGHALSYAAWHRWGRHSSPRITDTLHGYRGMTRAFTESLRLRPAGVTADLEMVRHAYRTQSRVLEVPVAESVRVSGETHFPALKTGRSLIRYLLSPESP